MMRRTALAMVVLAALTARSASAVVIINPDLYPAEITLTLTPDVAVENGVSFFSQSGTPNSLNLFSTNTFTLTADVPNDVTTTLDGHPPFGVYRTFTSQHSLFLGTYVLNDTTGVLAMLAPGVGVGEAFEDVFPGYTEAAVIAALETLGPGGDGSGLGLLFGLASSSLDKQAEWVPVDVNTFTLTGALVRFSDGVAAGPANGQAVLGTPEPGTLGALALGGLVLAGLARRGRRG